MISPAGWCFYRLVLERSASGALSGRAEGNPDPRRHPGICGDRPRIALADGCLVLRSTSTKRIVQRLLSGQRIDWGRPSSEVRLKVGAAFGAIAREGDRLEVARGGTAEIAVALFRGEDLQIAAGALTELDLSGVGILEEDPRGQDEALYGIDEWLAAPGCELVWVNADDDAERAVAKVSAAGGRDLVIAIAGRDAVARRNLNRRLASPFLGRGSRRFADVDERFTHPEQWLDYIRSLPRKLPPDLWLKLRIGSTVVTLHEGKYVVASPWQVYLVRVSRDGIPGSRSQLGIARENPALTREVLLESTDLIAAGGDILINK